MRDGVRIAIDLHLPEAARRGERVPTIVRQTRYLRGVEWRTPLDRLVDRWFVDTSWATRRHFLAHGYAWVDVDARGSGASFGQRPCPWHEEEVRDGAEVVDWIVAQSWSSGRVGAMGVSYEGTTAEMLLVNGHPAVKAVIPQFSLFDAYADVAFPGGIHFAGFTEFWAAMNRGFDQNEPEVFLGMYLSLRARGRLDKLAPPLSAPIAEGADRLGKTVMGALLRGVRRAGEDDGYGVVADAVRAHAHNEDIHHHALAIDFRDDAAFSKLLGRGASIDSFSPSAYADRIDASGAAVLGYSGWWDMGYANGALKRHAALRNPQNRVVIGPWDHGGGHEIGPSVSRRATRFDHHAEHLRFFDLHLKGEGEGVPGPVRYYTMGEERWKTCDEWPPVADVERLYLAPGRALAGEAPTSGGFDTYRIDPDATTGHLSRWKNGVGMPIDYSDRARCDGRLLTYDSPPLDRDTEVTGHPIVTLFFAVDAPDAQVFAYLEEIAPSGEVRYVTEGALRAVHRKFSLPAGPARSTVVPRRSFLRADAMPLVPGEPADLVFDLQPTSYLFRRGSRIRLAIAGADRDHARPLPEPPTSFLVHRGGPRPSHLALPVCR
jgi:putative CocE/NonD family hydrolase